jgi:mono/diheme cytochrome c family protein
MIEKYATAEELKRLLSGLAVVLGCLILAALFASIVVPGLRNANKPPAPAMVSPVAGETGWLDQTEFPPQRGAEIPPVDPKILIESSPAIVERGKQLFEENCSQCHGQLGRGDGPAAATMNPRPRNFASAEGWKNGYDMPGIFLTLSKGIPGTSMASFDYMSKKDRMALVHYVQSLGAVSSKQGNPQAMEALSKELAAPGEKTSNKIPISMAIAKLEAEFSAAPPLAISSDLVSPASDVLRRAVEDPNRAAQTLSELKSWRLSPEEFASVILPDVPGNGFSVGAATLSASEWKILHAELLKRIRSK